MGWIWDERGVEQSELILLHSHRSHRTQASLRKADYSELVNLKLLNSFVNHLTDSRESLRRSESVTTQEAVFHLAVFCSQLRNVPPAGPLFPTLAAP